MIDRTSQQYKEDIYRVKIGHAFLEKGYDIKGVIHIGANDGEEVFYYLRLGIDKVLCFEPLPSAIELFKGRYASDLASGRLRLIEVALGEEHKTLPLRIAPNEGKSSTFLRVNPEFAGNSPFKDTEDLAKGTVDVLMTTFEDIVTELEINLNDYDCLVIDVEGMELSVLKGMGDLVKRFKYLNIECSAKAVFAGQTDAQFVVDYLEGKGFHQDTPIEPHNDIMFTRKDLL